jgi:methionyl-tRNA formyltransferase
MRIVFMGSPEFAVPVLAALAEPYQVTAAFTQPDRAKGRGRQPSSPAVKIAAIELGIEVLQPLHIRSSETLQQLKELDPDLIVVAAYGQILPQELLEVPRKGAINVHASLLPRWRGASPVQAAIYHRDSETGVTIMKMDAGLDTGPILSQRRTHIKPDETGGELTMRLAYLGSEVLLESLPLYAAGQLQPIAQEDELATHAPMLKKTDGRIDLNRTAEQLAAQIRAYEPWPGSYLLWNDEPLRVRRAYAAANDRTAIGDVIAKDDKPALGTADGLLILDQVQPPSRKTMPGDAFLRGHTEFLSSDLE